ncbi:flagellar motor switch protein FliG [Candidatus Nucleicultrix amoebiphila]|jgi:flagellar motor switch protein FliG|uniref:Flagellar motor switch protein FliG n=1 Tax=Candidatus Nucleicultrix amoebiphila FS5 TaxID=1414854 RepID=A0A1W6N698_9PROT|nr:flagellar motor switch protein FliG [Candidatus Nucleicultrix amoebiphila]ARN85266.1 flagellar motor switch protein FliG [Candidatus Nucleicultrix amoebiphila FS5]
MSKAEEKINGTEKAAIFMLSLNKERATKILERLAESEVRELSHKMATLGSVKSKLVEAIYGEFIQRFFKTGGTITGGVESTERFLASIFDERKVRDILSDISGPAGRTMWDKLSNVNEDFLANYLKNENPQIVAVILSKIRPAHSARVFSMLPDEFAIEVVLRMLHMESVSSEVLENVEKTLRNEFMANLSRTSQSNPYEHMAEVFNAFDRSTESRFMTALEQKNTESAEKIRALMFTFDDLIKLDAAGIQTLIRVIDKSKLALALKGTTDTVKELFFKNMSERAGKLLKEDMESLGMVRLKAVDEAQQEIINQTKELAAKGEITISSGTEEADELVG